MTERMIDLTAPTERAFLIGLDDPRDGWPVARSLAELAALAETAGATVIGSAFQRRAQPDPAWYFGKGRAAELVTEKAASDFNLLVVDDELSPAQQRNLEQLLNCKVLDRSALIIDIFAQRARTREGRLQVKLAQLEYHLPRLTRMWTHLSRTGGGIGTRGGPGESQLETDRRLIGEQIRRVRSELESVKRHRATATRQRESRQVASLALVGYTNAGKSTLLNALAGANLYAENMLFATLDPTSRQVVLPSGQRVVMTDTVGFINKLPHDLVDAFRATLEEVVRADLLLEVVDAADADFVAQQQAVQRVLDELGAGDKPRITVFNKIDLLDIGHDGVPMPSAERAAFVSAATGQGLPELLEQIGALLREQMVAIDAVIPYDRGELVALARHSGDVTEHYGPSGVRISGHLPPAIAGEVDSARRATGR